MAAALVPLDRRRCPTCGAILGRQAWVEAALLVGCGYGEWRRTTVRWCGRCGWSLTCSVESVSPDRPREAWPSPRRCPCTPRWWGYCMACGRTARYLDGTDEDGERVVTCSRHHVGAGRGK